MGASETKGESTFSWKYVVENYFLMPFSLHEGMKMANRI